MIISGISAILAGLLYLYAISLALRCFKKAPTLKIKNTLFRITLIASLFHFVSFSPSLLHEEGIYFSLGLAISIITWGAVTTLLITNINRATGILGVFIYPFALISVALFFNTAEPTILSRELGMHVLLSVMAYSVLSLAAAQAILYSMQEKRFQQRQISQLFKALPPLQTMEKLLIQLIIIGFSLLTLALLSGAYFIEDMFAQHLIHKTFFALLSWSTYGIFLLGHFKQGWRGQKAAKYILWAYSLLILSYLGTQVVITFVL